MSIDKYKEVFKNYYVNPTKDVVRAEVRVFSFKMHLITKNRVKIEALISADPKIGMIPQSLLDYAIRKVIKHRIISVFTRHFR